MIQVHRLTVRFESGLEALRDVSLRVHEGELLFVSGRSGSGKSTLLSVLAAERRATAGQVVVAGRNLGVMKTRQVPYLRRTIGRLWQDIRLVSELNVRENVALPLEVLGLERARRRRRVDEVLELVGMARYADHAPRWLSSLEQQRVALARAIVHEPALVLADEPTGNLDPEGAREIIQMLRDLRRSGLTVLIATRDPNLVAGQDERVVLLNKGFLIEDRADNPLLPGRGPRPEGVGP